MQVTHSFFKMTKTALMLTIAQNSYTTLTAFCYRSRTPAVSRAFTPRVTIPVPNRHAHRLLSSLASNDRDDHPMTFDFVNGTSTGTLEEQEITPRQPNRYSSNKYLAVLDQTGLTHRLHATTLEMPPRRISDRDVFCNREIKLETIRAIGFDMDYTLAQYKQPEFDKLAFDGAVKKLVSDKGYPEAVLNFTYDNADKFWIRGLIIDTQRGNFLKIDRHKYVRVAYHGFSPVSSKVRKSLYMKTFNKIPSFSEKHFVNLDTLFQHVDAHLFAALIDLKDGGEFEFLDLKTYEELYKDVRACVDLCHRDGTYLGDSGSILGALPHTSCA
jgi:hypothetical protein